MGLKHQIKFHFARTVKSVNDGTADLQGGNKSLEVNNRKGQISQTRTATPTKVRGPNRSVIAMALIIMYVNLSRLYSSFYF